MLTFRRFRAPALLLVLAGALAAATTGRPIVARQDPQPVFRTEANYVRVDVYPTLEGVPVTDLTAADFEVLEDKVPQKLEQFEHVVVRGSVAVDARRDPNTVAASREALATARGRVFVLFLDPGSVDVAGSHNIRQPLTTMLDRLIGADDLVGVMTPDMSVRDVTFARKTTTIERFLARYWTWGEVGRLNLTDPIEQRYEACYGLIAQSAVTAEMVARHREQSALMALRDLVVFLRTAREERKAVLAITTGWPLYTPSSTLTAGLKPSPPPVTTRPGTGRLTIGDSNNATGSVQSDCDRDRQALAQLDDESEFRRLLDLANRGNVSFYPVNPGGLETGVDASSPGMTRQAATVGARTNTLRTLAEATDGLAVVNRNDLGPAMTRIVSDLSSYYLLGYYSTNVRADGRFHALTVRVKRPGVQVRARRGYLAPTAAELRARTDEAPAARSAAEAAEAPVIEAALAPLSSAPRDDAFRVRLTAGWKPGTPESEPVFRAVGELPAAIKAEFKDGGTFDAVLSMGDGVALGKASARLAPGASSVEVTVVPPEPIDPGMYLVRLTGQGAGGRVSGGDRAMLPVAPNSTGAVFIRRGPSTLNREVATADVRFRRSEQLRIEMPTISREPPSARLLDRTGKVIPVPVAVAIRDDPDGTRWRTAQLSLAPLAPSDYIIEVKAGTDGAETRTLVAFKIVP